MKSKLPEINLPNAYEIYNGKSVLFHRRVGRRIVPTVGTFVVGLNSKWVKIEWLIGVFDGKRIEEQIPICQEILQDVKPNISEIFDVSAKPVDFLIEPPIHVVPAE